MAAYKLFKCLQWSITRMGNLLLTAWSDRWSAGECRGTEVHFKKQYIGQHSVLYEGEVKSNTMDGRWTIELSNDMYDSDSFHLEQQGGQSTVDANGGEVGIVQVGEMKHWKGYFERRSTRSDVSADLVFTHTNRIYGAGEDHVGRFTWIGEFRWGPPLLLLFMLLQI